MMKIPNDLKKTVLDKVKYAQTQVQSVINDPLWKDAAMIYLERQKREMKKLITEADFGRYKQFLEKENRNLETLQKQIPQEVDRVKKYLIFQKKELEKLLKRVKNSQKRAIRSEGPVQKTTGNRKRRIKTKKQKI